MANVIIEDLARALKVFENPKFMVTKDSNDEPNVALVMSWDVYEKDRLVYGDFMTYKTRKNLEAGNIKMSILVMTLDLDNWLIKADFESFHRNDEYYEFMAMTPLFRYSQYTNARAAGVADAVWASNNLRICKLPILSSYLKAKRARSKVRVSPTEEGNLPLNVRKRFDMMAAVKVLAFIDDDGYPVAMPCMGMVSAAPNALVVNRGEEKRRGYSLKDGQHVAVLLVTMEPQVFQVKGTFRIIDDNSAYIQLDSVYACSLPRPGERIDVSPLKRVEVLK